MIPERFINTGDVGVIVKPKGLLAKLIGLFTKNKSHSFCFCREWGKLYVYEMKGFGIFKTLYTSTYGNESGWQLMKCNYDYSKDQKEKYYNFLMSVYQLNYEYDTNTLLKHAYYKAMKRFPSELKSDMKLICSELNALAANAAQPYTFSLPESVTPLDIYNSKFYYKWKI
jgi:hypothetical protein